MPAAPTFFGAAERAIDAFARSGKPYILIGYCWPFSVSTVPFRQSNRADLGVYQDFAAIGAAAVNRLNVMLQSCERGIPARRGVTALFGQGCPGKTLRRIPAGEATSAAVFPFRRSRE